MDTGRLDDCYASSPMLLPMHLADALADALPDVLPGSFRQSTKERLKSRRLVERLQEWLDRNRPPGVSRRRGIYERREGGQRLIRLTRHGLLERSRHSGFRDPMLLAEAVNRLVGEPHDGLSRALRAALETGRSFGHE